MFPALSDHSVMECDGFSPCCLLKVVMGSVDATVGTFMGQKTWLKGESEALQNKDDALIRYMKESRVTNEAMKTFLLWGCQQYFSWSMNKTLEPLAGTQHPPAQPASSSA